MVRTNRWGVRARLPVFPLIALAVIWMLSPGVPVLIGPRAGESEIEAGRALFVHEWTENDPLAHGDGLGPVFNATSCVACHSQGGVGGGGGVEHNVLAFESHPTIHDRDLATGLVHAFAVDPEFQECADKLRDVFPVIPGGRRLVGGCFIRIDDFDPLHTQRVNSTALFGAGWIDRISAKAIKYNHRRRMLSQVAKELGGDFDTIPAGRVRVLPDGRVGKFGWKAQFATLEEFVAAACANELGLGNPLMDQAQPLGTNYTSPRRDMTAREFGQLVAFVDTLARPIEAAPVDADDRAVVERGRELFDSIGCAACHTPDVDGVEGVYSDFLLHDLNPRDGGDGYRVEPIVEVPLPASHPNDKEWKTPPLWGVADSAPYFHDGGSPTLAHAIVRHRGQAQRVTDRFKNLPKEDQSAIIMFLQSLRAPNDAIPVERATPSDSVVAVR